MKNKKILKLRIKLKISDDVIIYGSMIIFALTFLIYTIIKNI